MQWDGEVHTVRCAEVATPRVAPELRSLRHPRRLRSNPRLSRQQSHGVSRPTKGRGTGRLQTAVSPCARRNWSREPVPAARRSTRHWSPMRSRGAPCRAGSHAPTAAASLTSPSPRPSRCRSQSVKSGASARARRQPGLAPPSAVVSAPQRSSGSSKVAATSPANSAPPVTMSGKQEVRARRHRRRRPSVLPRTVDASARPWQCCRGDQRDGHKSADQHGAVGMQGLRAVTSSSAWSSIVIVVSCRFTLRAQPAARARHVGAVQC